MTFPENSFEEKYFILNSQVKPVFAYVVGFKDEAIRIKTDSESTDGTARVTADREDMANNDPACGIHLSNKKQFHHTILNILARSDKWDLI